MLRSLELYNGFWCGFFNDRVIQEEGSYVYNIVEKHFSFSIAPVQSRGGALVNYKTCWSHHHSRFISKGVAEVSQIFLDTPTFYQNYLATKNIADVTGGKPIVDWSQSISGVSAINPLVAFYDIHGRQREVLLFYFVYTTRDCVWKYDIKFYFYCNFSITDRVLRNIKGWYLRWWLTVPICNWLQRR
jgi:hypothetical protein